MLARALAGALARLALVGGRGAQRAVVVQLAEGGAGRGAVDEERDLRGGERRERAERRGLRGCFGVARGGAALGDVLDGRGFFGGGGQRGCVAGGLAAEVHEGEHLL